MVARRTTNRAPRLFDSWARHCSHSASLYPGVKMSTCELSGRGGGGGGEN